MTTFKVKYTIPGSSKFNTRLIEDNSAAGARRQLLASIPSAKILGVN